MTIFVFWLKIFFTVLFYEPPKPHQPMTMLSTAVPHVPLPKTSEKVRTLQDVLRDIKVKKQEIYNHNSAYSDTLRRMTAGKGIKLFKGLQVGLEDLKLEHRNLGGNPEEIE